MRILIFGAGVSPAACDPKPDIDALTKFYREFFLRQRIIIAALKRRDMLKPSEVKRQIAIGERSQTPRIRLHGSSRFRSRMKTDILPFSPDAADVKSFDKANFQFAGRSRGWILQKQ